MAEKSKRGGARPGAGRPRKGDERYPESPAAVDHRKARAIADLREMERDALADKLVDRRRVELAMTTLGAEVAEALRGWPDRLALVLANRPADELAPMLDLEVEAVLSALRQRLDDPGLVAGRP